MALKPDAIRVLNYVKENDNSNFTAAEIADALGIDVKRVNGIVTQAFTRRKFMVRVEAERENEDGTHTKVKYIHMTPEGKAYDFEAAEEK